MMPGNDTTHQHHNGGGFDLLRRATQAMMSKALSTARPSQSDGKDSVSRTSNDGAEASGTQTPRSTGAQVPAARGKLTVKISEARGLRKCHDPYVVAVFQRSELISSGPRPSDDEEPLNVAQAAIGGIPIQRSGSDSGRPMAIPMRSRQSSNTSITDYNTFRSRNGRNAPLTNPKWDAEAVFDVVDSGSLVDVSLYDHTPSGEEFLGHVNFEAPKEKETPVRGWFPLKGHVNTVAEAAPTVQANFRGFTFVDESALDDHMGDRARNDDEDMDDASQHTNGNDDDWDNLDDFDARRDNRMSGIVRTSTHDEQMVGGGHFDV
ncbi:Serine/threonine-protein kinase SCH9 [Beauveria bassiana]|nr:Serine/threonine-protein kinase SCH9 [Beauveria bassiana]